MNLCVVGTGYVGLVSGVCFAEKGNNVICLDVNEDKINNLNKGIMPIYENGLKEMCNTNRENQKIEFTTNFKYAVEKSDIIFIAVGTPSLSDGQADLSQVETSARNIAIYMNGYKVIVNKSTVPVGTQKWVTELIKQNQVKAYDFDVVSNPEFLKEGTAIYDTMNADRIVIGSESEKATQHMKELYMNFKQPIIITTPESAEMIKYAANAFLATKITFINEIANICEKVGADVEDVAKVIGMDNRISPKFLKAGIGFGGSCFPKDTRALLQIGRQFGYEFDIVNSTIKVNERQKLKPVEKLLNAFEGNIEHKKIAILGLAYKPNTDDVREAPSITIIKEIQKLGGIVKAYDPIAVNNAKNVLKNVEYAESAYEAVTDTDAVILATEWDEFLKLNLNKVRVLMKGNIFIDGRNVFEYDIMKNYGFRYYCIGRIDKMYNRESFKEVAVTNGRTL